MKDKEPIHVLEVVIRYRQGDETKELIFGKRGLEPMPCSIYFSEEDARKAFSAIGGNNGDEMSPSEEWLKQTGGARPRPRTLDDREVAELGLSDSRDPGPQWPRLIDKICWHYCPCDWDCGPD